MAGRTWCDSTGKYSVDAELVDFDYDRVILKKASDGSWITIPMERLGSSERGWVDDAINVRRQQFYDVITGRQPPPGASLTPFANRPPPTPIQTDQELIHELLDATVGKSERFSGKVIEYEHPRIRFLLNAPVKSHATFRTEMVLGTIPTGLAKILAEMQAGDQIHFEGKLKFEILPCPICHGTDKRPCENCNGRGRVKGPVKMTRVQMPLGTVDLPGGYSTVNCPKCGGSGSFGQCNHNWKIKDWQPFSSPDKEIQQRAICAATYSGGRYMVFGCLDKPTVWIVPVDKSKDVILVGKKGKPHKPEHEG